jgi:hypothetical protein
MQRRAGAHVALASGPECGDLSGYVQRRARLRYPGTMELATSAPRLDATGLGAFLLGTLALAWVPAALWPGAGLPAWPSVSAGLVAMGLSMGRGRPVIRALAAITGLAAAVLGSIQIAVLWGIAAALPGG